MNKIKSIIFTALSGILFFGFLYVVPITKKSKSADSQLDIKSDYDESVQDSLAHGIVDVDMSDSDGASVKLGELENLAPKEEPKQEVSAVEPKQEESPEPEPKQEEQKEEVVSKEKAEKTETNKKNKEDKNKDSKNTKLAKNKETESKKTDTKSKETEKEPEKEKSEKITKIGVDRKLVSGIPGTNKYKGKFPTHNVKEKGSITISYTVDANGNVISAQRIDGLRSRNAINNAITLVRKYVKAEKGKNKSTGTYTINFN